jgi:hypothetical protein
MMKRSITYAALACSVLLPVSLRPALAQQVPSAETNAAPAAASLSGNLYVAWKGKDAGGSYIWYSVAYGSQQSIGGALTTQAPALTATSSTVYLAWRGQSSNTTDKIYYATNTGSGWVLPSNNTVCNGSNCAYTTAAPALATDGSNIYAAWTTQTNTIMYAVYSGGAWGSPLSTPAATNSGAAPALIVYGEELYLAWIAAGSSQVMYATMPLSTGTWSASAEVTGALSSVAPAWGIFANPPASLYMAWTTAGGSIDYADWDDGWSAPVPISGLPVPPGPLSPALVSIITTGNGTGYSLSVVYAAPVSGESYSDVYVHEMLDKYYPPPPPHCHGTTCT